MMTVAYCKHCPTPCIIIIIIIIYLFIYFKAIYLFYPIHSGTAIHNFLFGKVFEVYKHLFAYLITYLHCCCHYSIQQLQCTNWRKKNRQLLSLCILSKIK